MVAEVPLAGLSLPPALEGEFAGSVPLDSITGTRWQQCLFRFVVEEPTIMRVSQAIVALLLVCCTADRASAELVNKYRLAAGTANWSNAQWSLNADGTGTTVTPTAADYVIFNVDSLNAANIVSQTRGNRAVGGFEFRSAGTTVLNGGNGDYNLDIGAAGITMLSGAGHVTIGATTSGGAATTGTKLQPRLTASQIWTNNSAVSNLYVPGGGTNNVIRLNGHGLTLAGVGDFVLGEIRGGALGGNAKIVGDLNFSNLDPFGLLFNPMWTLNVSGTTTFGVGTGLNNSFGIANLVGLDSTVEIGSYTLINGNVDFTKVINVGLASAVGIGDGKLAYFSDGSLVLNVEPVPEPSSLVLVGVAGCLFGLRRQRRKVAGTVA